MLFKFLILLVLLFLAYGYAVWLLKRLTNTSQQIAELRSQLLKNDELLGAKVAALEEKRERAEVVTERGPEDAGHS
jgi:hypothetical protein